MVTIADLLLVVFQDLVSEIQNCGLGCGLTQSGMLIVTVAISFLSQFGLICTPFMQAIFQPRHYRSTTCS